MSDTQTKMGFMSLVLLCLTGCAAGPPPPVFGPIAINAAEGKNTSTIILNRANARVLGHNSGEITLNGNKIGEIKNGQCVRLTIPAGNHNLHVHKGSIFNSIGSSIGNAFAEGLAIYNVKAVPGQTLHYAVKPHYDSPNVGWLLITRKQESGPNC